MNSATNWRDDLLSLAERFTRIADDLGSLKALAVWPFNAGLPPGFASWETAKGVFDVGSTPEGGRVLAKAVRATGDGRELWIRFQNVAEQAWDTCAELRYILEPLTIPNRIPEIGTNLTARWLRLLVDRVTRDDWPKQTRADVKTWDGRLVATRKRWPDFIAEVKSGIENLPPDFGIPISDRSFVELDDVAALSSRLCKELAAALPNAGDAGRRLARIRADIESDFRQCPAPRVPPKMPARVESLAAVLESLGVQSPFAIHDEPSLVKLVSADPDGTRNELTLQDEFFNTFHPQRRDELLSTLDRWQRVIDSLPQPTTAEVVTPAAGTQATENAAVVDLRDYEMVSRIIAKHAPDGVVLNVKRVHRFLAADGQAIRTHKPHPRRFYIHLGDWVRSLDALQEWYNAERDEFANEAEAAKRREAIKREKQHGK